MKTLWVLYKTFFMINILTFGGGYAMLPMLEKEIVNNKKWATMDEISDYYAVSQCTPGVIAVNVATFIGYKQKKIMGGVVATLGAVTPSIIIVLLLSGILEKILGYQIVKSAFSGIAVAVCALLIQALLKLTKSGIKDVYTALVAIISAIVSILFKLSPIIIVLVTGVVTVLYKFILEKAKGGKKKC